MMISHRLDHPSAGQSLTTYYLYICKKRPILTKYMSEISRDVIFSEKKGPCGNANTSHRGWGGGGIGGVISLSLSIYVY